MSEPALRPLILLPNPLAWRILPIALAVFAGAAGGLLLVLIASASVAHGALAMRLQGDATVAVAPSVGDDLESPEAAAWRAVEALSATPGVRDARVEDPRPGDPAIIAGLLGAQTPAPPRNSGALIAVHLQKGARAPELAPRLNRLGLAAGMDGQGMGASPLRRGLGLTLASACAALAALAFAVGLAVWDLTLRRLQAHAPRLRALARWGMSDVRLAQAVWGVDALAALAAACGGGILGALLAPGLAGAVLPWLGRPSAGLLAQSAVAAVAGLAFVALAAGGATLAWRLRRVAP